MNAYLNYHENSKRLVFQMKDEKLTKAEKAFLDWT